MPFLEDKEIAFLGNNWTFNAMSQNGKIPEIIFHRAYLFILFSLIILF